MITEKELLAEWDFVRKNFFPRWDRKKQWRVLIKPDLLNGRCHFLLKEIWVGENWAFDDLRWLLIHEICHNWGGGMHGNGWQQRMRKAIEKAKRLGLHDLAENMEEDVNQYAEKEPVKINAAYVYGSIEKVIRNFPDANFNTVVTFVAAHVELHSHELLHKYKRAERVYKAAKKEACQVPSN